MENFLKIPEHEESELCVFIVLNYDDRDGPSINDFHIEGGRGAGQI